VTGEEGPVMLGGVKKLGGTKLEGSGVFLLINIAALTNLNAVINTKET
jgi:hypothetical protein